MFEENTLAALIPTTSTLMVAVSNSLRNLRLDHKGMAGYAAHSRSAPLMARMQKFAGYYTSAALLVLNICIALIALNFILYILFVFRDKRRISAYVIAQKYGDASLLRVYPDLDVAAIKQLLNETWSRRPVFEAYTHFKEAPFRGKFVNVSAAGFRLSKNQGAWPPPADSFHIFVFGGSTTLLYRLADNETVGS